MRSFLTFLTLVLMSSATAQTSVYRSVDKDGNVTFTDRPSPSGEKLVVPPVQTFSAPPPRPGATLGPPLPPDSKVPEKGYDLFEIVSPAPDEAVRSNGGTVTVGLRIEPDLREGDRLEVLLDGRPAGESSRSTVQSIANVARGEHRIAARIVSREGKELMTAGPVTFHLLRASVR